jgi:DMSO/TMAO reductase YedYZ heme-binding membrane subunit
MEILLGLNMVLYLAGYLLPVLCAVVAWRGWIQARNIAPVQTWQHWASQIALALLTAGIVLWSIALVRQYRGADLYETFTTNLETLAAALLIIPSALAKKGSRRWLTLGALGLLFFFAISTGEVAI